MAQFEELYDYVRAMVRDNVAHTTKHFRLGEMSLDDMLCHLAEEAHEVEIATNKLDRQMEISDCFGVVLHMAIDAGLTPEQLVGATFGKLQVRFEKPKDLR
jgi:NTP pyrophosphatase (non-canonical NTP hydrolase)